MIIRCKTDLHPTFTMLYKQAEKLLDCGKLINVEVKEHKTRRSLEQNAYYWLICGQVGEFLSDAGLSYGDYNLPYTSELIHEINKQVFGKRTTTKMTTSEFCDYTTKIVQFWQEKTSFDWQPSELPESWLIAHGYNKRDLL